MEGLILLVVLLALLTLALLLAWMVLDVAFLGGARKVEERERARRRWQPPYLGGRELVAWGRATAQEAVQRAFARGPSTNTLTDLTDDLHGGSARAMLPRIGSRELKRAEPCPENGQGEIGVTAPEALAIADHIRATLPKREQERILRRATAISAARPVTLAAGRRDQPPRCALQGEDCVCMTYSARPLRCRPHHAAATLRRLSAIDGGDDGAATDMAHARGVIEGVEEGLVEALRAAGRDGDVYELNAALSLALGDPDATRRWLAGEAVFASCPRGPATFPRL